MKNPLTTRPAWAPRLAVAVALPLIVMLAVVAFTWPSARIRPRDVPVGIVGTTVEAQRVIAHLDAVEPGGFAFRVYSDADGARSAIRSRVVYGAVIATDADLEVMEASAAGPAVATLLTSAAAGTPGVTRVSTVDVVPISTKDTKGLVLSSAVLPLTICSIVIAATIGVAIRVRPAWRQLVAVTAISAIAAAGAYAIGQGWLGAFPYDGAGDWLALTLTILAMSSATAGLVAVVGVAGLAVAAALFVFVGNPFAAASSAPQLLPDAADHIGQWLPPGAGLNLIRSWAYFDGNGSAAHVAVLVVWSIGGFLAILIGHRAQRYSVSALNVAAEGVHRRSVPSAVGSGEVGVVRIPGRGGQEH